jgi:septal ring factor EnvC (AmiA/AmiB activator)
MRRFFCIAALFALPAVGEVSERPPEALLAERNFAEAELRDLERRSRALGEQSAERRERLKRRLRALYKLSNGGSLRLLFADPAQLAARHDAVRRILARDLDELSAVREEAREVDAEQARRQEALSRAVALSEELEKSVAARQEKPAAARQEKPVAMGQEKALATARLGQLVRPVPGPILHSFGGYRDHGVEVVRRGAELQSQPGQPVRAAAAARVAWIGEAPGVGPAVALEHGAGWMTLYGRVRASLAVGQSVHEGGALGHALGTTVYFELAQEGTPLDPAPWMQPPR